ncbi:hypothetical protein HU200_059380 [Digitaria exilis]|uniref:Pentatricopeptide repeat-containing protein n=1 Tax=Digitaria exilis TaxID=1010633 RepID=A0A835DYW4_9POAL|nr:hypothetical protein HU200_059380 [Digitaria exilis]
MLPPTSGPLGVLKPRAPSPPCPVSATALRTAAILRALSTASAAHLHAHAVKLGVLPSGLHLCSSLLKFYAASGRVAAARQLFVESPRRDVPLSNALLSAYARSGHSRHAMARDPAGARPNGVCVCAAEELGAREGAPWDSGFVDGHDTSTCHEWAWSCFLVRFAQMLREGFQPDGVIFLSVIHACGHSSLVNEGRQLFKSMVEEYGITPWMEHYGSMVDMLCRAGALDEAFEFVLAMPVKPDPVIWRVLAGACRDHGNASLARKVMDHVIRMDPDHEGNYVLASNLYAVHEDWRSVVDVRLNMGGRKGTSRCVVAASYVEVNGD